MTYYFHSFEHFIVLVWYYHIPGLPYILFFIFQSPKQWSQAVRRVATSYTRPWTGLLPSEGWYEWITVWGNNITGSYMRSKAGNCPVDSEDRGHVLCRTSVFRNTENNRCWWGCGEIETPVCCRWRVKWHSHCARQFCLIPQKIKQNSHMIQQFRSWVYPKELQAETSTDIWATIFLAALFTWEKGGNSPSVHHLMME